MTAFSYESAEQVCISVILLGTSGGSRLAVLPETELKARENPAIVASTRSAKTDLQSYHWDKSRQVAERL